MKLNKIAQVLLAASCLVSGAVSANTLTLSSNVIGSQETDWTAFLNFNQFNPTLGTLTSVKFDLYANVAGSVTLTNYNDDEATVPVKLSVDAWLQRPDLSTLVLYSAPLINQNATIAGGLGSVTLSNSYTASGSSTFSGAGDLGLFTGPGSVSTKFSATAYTEANGDGIEADFSTTAGGYGQVTYTYTAAVPEPETYGMLLLGLGMLAFVAKRKARGANV